MKVVCAWCNKTLKDDKLNDKEVSHGICKSCKEIEYNRFIKTKKYKEN